MRNIAIVVTLFILYEGFWLLPEKLVVPFPGSLRISDVFFIVFPIVAIIFCKQILLIFRQYTEETMLVLGACALMFLSPLMANIFFDQPYDKGLLLVRHNLNYLAFFVFILLLRDKAGLDGLLKMLAILVGLYVVILIVTKYFPDLGLIHYREGYYSKGPGSFSRFGEFRLFFPYGDVPIFLYCLLLARWIHSPPDEPLITKAGIALFLLLIIYAVYASYTRMLMLSLSCTTLFALFTSNRPVMKYVTIAALVFFFSLAVIRAAIDTQESKLDRVMSEGGNLGLEKGRKMQAEVFLQQFMRSPMTGVGTLINVSLRNSFLDKDLYYTYRKHGFFNTVDTGYPKIAAEFGLAGLAWVLWYFSYIYRRSRQSLSKATKQGGELLVASIARGHLYFLMYLVVSGVTIPHFVYADGVNILALSLAMLAVARMSIVANNAGQTAMVTA